MKPAAIMASLVDVRNVAAHKSVRLEIHVPAEQAGAVLEAFGWPTMADPVPVAIARLGTETGASESLNASSEGPKAVSEVSRAVSEVSKPEDRNRRAWNDLPAVQQAGIRCGEKGFWRFLEFGEGRGPVSSAEHAAQVVRARCCVSSRSAFLPGTPAELRWQAIEAAYQNWRANERYSEVAR